MNVEPDLYAVLGVAQTASAAEITRACHRLVRQFHPDANPAGTPQYESLQDVLAAYAVLRNPVRRAEYDRRVDRHRVDAEDRSGDQNRRTGDEHQSRPRPRRPAPAEEPLIRVGPVRYHGRR
jgi:curved DNA-binding protein CbpA